MKLLDLIFKRFFKEPGYTKGDFIEIYQVAYQPIFVKSRYVLMNKDDAYRIALQFSRNHKIFILKLFVSKNDLRLARDNSLTYIGPTIPPVVIKVFSPKYMSESDD